MTKLTRLDEAFINVPLMASSNFYKTENGVSAKAWNPFENEDLNPSNWSSSDLNIVLFSTGSCKLNFSVNAQNMIYNWSIRILDESSNELLSFDFAPFSIEGSSNRVARQFKMERRFRELNDEMVEKAAYIQLVNLS